MYIFHIHHTRVPLALHTPMTEFVFAKKNLCLRSRQLNTKMFSLKILGFLKLAGKMLMVVGLSSNKIKTGQKLVTSY